MDYLSITILSVNLSQVHQNIDFNIELDVKMIEII